MKNKTRKQTKKHTLNSLLKENKKFSSAYKKNKLMQLIKSDAMKDKVIREKLLDCVQVFSNYFQRIVLLRQAFSEDASFLSVSQEHLAEEFGHNLSLMKDRNNRPPIWDAILDAASSWFAWKMLTLDDEEKTLLVHLVLETSANMFFQETHKIMSKYRETDYFKIHSEADEKHEKMGIELLKGLTSRKYNKLFELQSQGWDMLNTACERIAQLTLGK